MVSDELHGRMEKNTLENILKIKNMVLGFSNGVMEEIIMGVGRMVSSTDKENMFLKMELLKGELGLTESSKKFKKTFVLC